MRADPTQLGFQPEGLGAARLLLEAMAPDEHIVWSGQPDVPCYTGTVMKPLFAACAFVFLATVGMLLWAMWDLPGYWPPSPLLGLVGVLVAWVTYRLLRAVAVRQARRTGYAVTNRRALIAADWPYRQVVSFTPEALQALNVYTAPGGAGWIVVSPYAYQSPADAGQWKTLAGIGDVPHVAALLRDLAGTASPEAVAALARERLRPRVNWWAGVVFGSTLIWVVLAIPTKGLRVLSTEWLYCLLPLVAALEGFVFARSIVHVVRHRSQAKAGADSH